MSRRTPLPQFSIAPNIITDCTTGLDLTTIRIDVKAGDNSNGFVVLDEPEDLFILRNYIDFFVDKHNLKDPYSMNPTENEIKDPDKKSAIDQPRFFGVIEGFINTQYRPSRGYNPDDRRNFRIMTSQEIILDLVDMVDIELNDVAEAMMFLGYRTIIHDGKVGWLLERRIL